MSFIKKQDFLEILKDVVNVLDEKDVQYQIPYCHLDKEEFNYIDIVITDLTNISDLIIELDMKDQKDENNILTGVIDDFRFNFIKSPVDFLNLTFYFYCWNFFPFLIKALVNPLNLSYTPYGLYFNHKGENILVSRNLQKILDFLNIDFKTIFGLNIPKKNLLFQQIINSHFYNSNSFSHDIFKQFDNMYEYNKHYYDEFLEMIPDYSYDFNYENDLNYIDDFFPEAELIKTITKKEFNKKEFYKK